jgi:hypothetical protein
LAPSVTTTAPACFFPGADIEEWVDVNGEVTPSLGKPMAERDWMRLSSST